MTVTDLLAMALAAFTLSELWFNENSFLQGLRRKGKLLNCVFCLSYWLPSLPLVVYLASMSVSDPVNAMLVKSPNYYLACTGILIIINRGLRMWENHVDVSGGDEDLTLEGYETPTAIDPGDSCDIDGH